MVCGHARCVADVKMVMHFAPAISARDNHLALEPLWWTRTLSYLSLHARYAGLLLHPAELS